jgi:hypothetical protein
MFTIKVPATNICEVLFGKFHNPPQKIKCTLVKFSDSNQLSNFLQLYRESFLEGDFFFFKMPKNLHASFAEMTHLAEGLCLSALLTLKVENSLICLVGT